MQNLLSIPCDFCSDVIIIKDFSYIVINNIFIEEHKKLYSHFNGQHYVDIIEKYIRDTNSTFFYLYGKRFISFTLHIFNSYSYSYKIPHKNLWYYKTVFNHHDYDIIGFRFCLFYLNNHKSDVSFIDKSTNEIIKFIPYDGTLFIYYTPKYKIINTNSKIKYITMLLSLPNSDFI